MELTQSLAFIGAGLAMLFVGAESLVRGSTSLALRMGIAPLVVGLTVVAFGTSSPELVVSVQAAIDGRGAIAVGNVVGSNIANIALILGLTALIRPMKVNTQLIRLDVPIVIASSLLLVALLFDGRLGRLDGALLSAGIVAYVAFLLRQARRERPKVKEDFAEALPGPKGHVGRDALFVVLGLGLLVLGANLLVDGAVAVAQRLDISEAIIGLTVVAIGTSLPELATSVVAALRREGDLAIGNVVGSNIFNILGILGLSSLVQTLDSGGIRMADLVVMVAIALLLFPMIWTGRRLSRAEGAFLLVCYAAYMAFLVP